MHSLYNKALKFLSVGGVSTIINYFTFILMYKIVDLHYLESSITGYIIGLIFGYMLNKNWTYKAQVSIRATYFHLYITLYMSSLIISQAVLYTTVEIIHILPEISNIIAIVISTTINFLGTNFWVFKKAKSNNIEKA